MLQREEYGPAVAWIEKHGLSSFADHAPLQDLQAMANAARYAGRGQTAVVLLVSLRTRFPGTAQAATAAFLMGRVYSEQLRDQRAAVSWFSTYLAEVPSGSLVEEALGRRMDAAQRAGMTSEARKSAATLVERYPASPFKPLAQQILGTDK
jgi:TolA-binding protein